MAGEDRIVEFAQGGSEFGGQHRSVYMTDKLAAALREFHDPVLTRHNELATLPLHKA